MEDFSKTKIHASGRVIGVRRPGETSSGASTVNWDVSEDTRAMGFRLRSPSESVKAALRARQQEALRFAARYRSENGDPIDDLAKILHVDEETRPALFDDVVE